MRVRAKHSAKLPALPSGLSTACVDPTCVLGRQVTSRLPDFHHGQTDSPLKHARDSSNTHQSYTCKCHRHPRCVLSLTDLACSAFQSGNRTSLVSGLNTPAPNPRSPLLLRRRHILSKASHTHDRRLRPPIYLRTIIIVQRLPLRTAQHWRENLPLCRRCLGTVAEAVRRDTGYQGTS